MFIAQIVTLPHILYSLALAAAELLLGLWLFKRRPSETADRGTVSKWWAAVTACLLAFAVLLMITVDSRKLFSVYGAAIVAVALLGFILYAFISLRNVKHVLLFLPFFLLSCALALFVSTGIDSMVDNALTVTPAADEIASVSFRGHDSTLGDSEYASIMLGKISFENDNLKQYVSEMLSTATDAVKTSLNGEYGTYDYNDYNQYTVIEPVTLKLTNGQTVRRTIQFASVDRLNELREENVDFVAAERAYPAPGNVQYVNMYVGNDMTQPEKRAIWDSLKAEAEAGSLVLNDYYRPRETSLDEQGYSLDRGDEQSLATVVVSGYVGTRRFTDSYQLLMSAPNTTALLMSTTNEYAQADTVSRLSDAVDHMLSPLVLQNDSVSVGLDFYNVPLDEGEPVSTSVSAYLDGYSMLNQNDSRYTALYMEYAQRIADIMQKAKFTDDPSGMFLCLDWYEYDGSTRTSNREPDAFMCFSTEDEAEVLTLIQDWRTDTQTGY